MNSNGKNILNKLLNTTLVSETEVETKRELKQISTSNLITPIGDKCKGCGKDYKKNHINEKYCDECKFGRWKESAKIGMRNSRKRRKDTKKIRNELKKKGNLFCQVCGYHEVVDIHHEGEYLFVLCPNHHALLTRRLQEIKDYDIIPITV